MARERSFQNEIPPSRVNIRYVKYTGGAQEKVELPLKLLLLGDYTLRPDDTPLEERKKISINKDNFESVMKEQKLSLDLLVPNRLGGGAEDLEVRLRVDSLQAFSPDALAKSVPELAKMLEVRELLSDLKARVITNRNFRLALEKIVKDPGQVESILKELDRVAPLPEVVSGKTEGES